MKGKITIEVPTPYIYEQYGTAMDRKNAYSERCLDQGLPAVITRMDAFGYHSEWMVQVQKYPTGNFCVKSQNQSKLKIRKQATKCTD